jgi:hypothetical protein
VIARSFAAGLLLVMLCAAGDAAAQVTARARLDSTEFLVGDPIGIRLEVSHPEGTILRTVVPDTSGGFVILSRPGFEAKSPTTSVGMLVLARYDSGQVAIGPVKVLYALAGDTAGRVTATNSLAVTVATVAVDTSKQIRDLKPPLSIPWSFWEAAAIFAGLVVLAAAGWFGYRYWRRRREKTPGEEPVVPQRPAHVIALEALAVLKAKKLWQQGKVKEYYSEATDILRRYIEQRYGVPALEETTDGILEGLQKHQFRTDLLSRVDAVLRRADMVKFARQQPGIPEHEKTFTEVAEVVETTKVSSMTPPAGGEGWVETHGGS